MAKQPPYVLIVDNEHIIADTLLLILKSQGYHAVSVHSGEEALSYAAQHPPHMLISDVIMGKMMTGFDLAIRLKDSFPRCKVLLISGQFAAAELLAQAQRAGYAFEILAKPVHPAEILERVKQVFAASDSDA